MVLLAKINSTEQSLLHYPLPSSLVMGWWLLSRSGGCRVRVLLLGSEAVVFGVLLVLSMLGDNSVSSLSSLIDSPSEGFSQFSWLYHVGGFGPIYFHSRFR
jgi:hypothetical protein